MAVHYQALNKISIKKQHPSLCIDDLSNMLLIHIIPHAFVQHMASIRVF